MLLMRTILCDMYTAPAGSRLSDAMALGIGLGLVCRAAKLMLDNVYHIGGPRQWVAQGLSWTRFPSIRCSLYSLGHTISAQLQEPGVGCHDLHSFIKVKQTLLPAAGSMQWKPLTSITHECCFPVQTIALRPRMHEVIHRI